MSTHHSTEFASSTQHNNTAKQIDPVTRQQIGISALAEKEPITELSRRHKTSRKFVYAQKQKAASAINSAFSNNVKDSDVLFYIPVTKAWLQQVVLSLILICHSSYGGVIEFFRDLFDQNICKGTIFNIVQNALHKAEKINRGQDLSSINVGAHDEIFQGKKPVLVGCDVESTYTYLLKNAEHRDTTTWGVHLLELTDQGMQLDHSIADGGKGMRSGQREAWPDVPCRGDVFHALYDIGRVVVFLKNRVVATSEIVEKLEVKMEKAKKKGKGNQHSKHLSQAREKAQLATQLAQDIAVLSSWLKTDILSVSGPELATRRELLNFIIDELQSRESQCPHRIRPVCRLLESQREDLLSFVQSLDENLKRLADTFDIDLYLVRQVFELQSLSTKEARYWQRTGVLYQKLGGRFYHLQVSIQNLINETVRASSLVENLNSRLRNYFFLRKTLGNGYLELLQFFLNHRRFMRSMRSERIGKSPKELLLGRSHDHWLELLGYKLFKQSGQLDGLHFLQKAAA